MGLARIVLALHDGIREVFVLEEKPGQYVVVDKANRVEGTSVLSETIYGVRKHAQMVPAVILGGAAQFTGEPDSLRLVGILYEKWGVIFVNLDEQRILVASTSPEALYSSMEAFERGLPELLERESHEAAGGVGSAVEAEEIARSYLARRFHGSISVDEISHRTSDRRWSIQGSYSSSRWGFSKRFHIELDANKGVVVQYSSSPPSRRHGMYFFFVEMACLLAILLAALALQHSLWR